MGVYITYKLWELNNEAEDRCRPILSESVVQSIWFHVHVPTQVEQIRERLLLLSSVP